MDTDLRPKYWLSRSPMIEIQNEYRRKLNIASVFDSVYDSIISDMVEDRITPDPALKELITRDIRAIEQESPESEIDELTNIVLAYTT